MRLLLVKKYSLCCASYPHLFYKHGNIFIYISVSLWLASCKDPTEKEASITNTMGKISKGLIATFDFLTRHALTS